MKNNNEIWINDDYAVMESNKMLFYYGYEYLVDYNGNLLNSTEADSDQVYDWAFVVKDFSNRVIKHYSTSQLEDFCKDIKGGMPAAYLMIGINQLMNDGTITTTKEQ